MPEGFIKARNVRRRTGNANDNQYGLAYYFNQGEQLKQKRKEVESLNNYRQYLVDKGNRDFQFKVAKARDTSSYRRAKIDSQNRMNDLKEEEMNIERATKKLKALSTEYSSVYDPTGIKFQNYQTSDQGKETIKYFKKHLPEQFDENGNLLLIKNHDLVKDQLKDKADSLQARIPALQSILRQPDLPPLVRKHYEEELKNDIAEATAFSIYKDPDLFSKAIDIAQHDTDNWATPEKRAGMIDQNYKMLAGAKMDSIGGFPESVQTQAPQVQPQRQVNPFIEDLMGGAMGAVPAMANFVTPQTQQSAPAPANIQIPQQSGEVRNPQGQQLRVPNYKILK